MDGRKLGKSDTFLFNLIKNLIKTITTTVSSGANPLSPVVKVEQNANIHFDKSKILVSELGDVSSAVPRVDEVLKWNGVTWAPSANIVGGGGEANIAVNAGLVGEGVAKDKNGVELPLKRINAASPKIAITSDSDKINIDVNVNQIFITGRIDSSGDVLSATSEDITAANLEPGTYRIFIPAQPTSEYPIVLTIGNSNYVSSYTDVTDSAFTVILRDFNGVAINNEFTFFIPIFQPMISGPQI